MNIRLKLVAMFVLVVVLPLAACSQSPQLLTEPSTPATTSVNTTPVMTLGDKARLEAMIAQHQRVRSQLSVEYQQELDQLTVYVRRQLFVGLPRDNLLTATVQIVSEFIPGLTAPEAASLAEYVLGGIASGDIADEALMNATKSMQEMSQSFNMQYLQLQQDMQEENRQFTLISNIMKTKHDTVNNSINNIR
ncbi:MAG: hypothetical protein PHN78_08185 [Dehalococcoidales bacterium]|nr:hypothetical protein [Dehalococcoidales bacterium]